MEMKNQIKYGEISGNVIGWAIVAAFIGYVAYRLFLLATHAH